MADNIPENQKTPRTRLLETKTINELKKVISSILDIHNKMTTCASNEVSPHLNDDYPLGNFNRDDEISLKRNFVISRTALDMGASASYMNWIHENNELANITRGRFGFQNKIIRSQFSTSDTKITEGSEGFRFGRSKEPGS